MIPCDSSLAHIQRLAAIGKDRRLRGVKRNVRK